MAMQVLTLEQPYIHSGASHNWLDVDFNYYWTTSNPKEK